MEQLKTMYYQLSSFAGDNIHINLHSNLTRLTILILFHVVVAFLINYLLVNSFLGRSYRLIVAPGIIVHELSHALFCVVTGAKITKISFFDKEGGSVQHTKSKLPIIGPVFISLAPFFIGTAIICGISFRLGIKEVDFSNMNLLYDRFVDLIRMIFSQVDFSLWQNWLILYLTVSVALTMTPSWQDLCNISLIIIFFCLLAYLNWRYTHFSISLAFLPFKQIFLLLDIVGLLLILILLFSMIVFAISKLFKS